jgi:putative DNA primase/helicase
MNSKLKLVEPTTPIPPLLSPPHSVSPRPVLTIVKALNLDAQKLPGSKSARKGPGSSIQVQAAANPDGRIPESGRNNALTSLAGSMRRKGMSEAAIEAALQAENVSRCDPTLDENEVSAIAASIMRYPASSPDDIIQSLNDAGNAVRFGASHAGEVIYVPGLGWHVWGAIRWCRDGVGKVMELAKQVARDIFTEAAVVSDDNLQKRVCQHATASLKASNLDAALKLARSLPELVVGVDQLDSHDMLLGVANGVIDLRAGKLLAAQRNQLITRHSSVVFDAKATCPQFLAFLDQVTGGGKTLKCYLQRVVGYALTGSTEEQCLFFLFGSGANGKSVFLNVVKEVLGNDLACQTPSETLMVKKSGGTNDIARLQNVRAVIANEVEDGTLLAESLVKQMTGGERLSARFHYQEFFEYMPKFKLFIAGNHKPVIRGRDNGIWRRIRLIPFTVTIPKAKQDAHLQSKLRAELPGILNWAIKGCRDWQKTGLAEPILISDAVEAYREEMDVLGAWQKDCCALGPLLETKASDAYRSYKHWSEQNGYRPMANGNFGRDLAAIFKRVSRKDGNFYVGVKCGQ